MKAVAQPAQMLSITQVAAVLGCSRGHIYDLVKAGHLKSIDIGAGTRSKARIAAAELDSFLAARSS